MVSDGCGVVDKGICVSATRQPSQSLGRTVVSKIHPL